MLAEYLLANGPGPPRGSHDDLPHLRSHLSRTSASRHSASSGARSVSAGGPRRAEGGASTRPRSR
eukprot:9401545-Pyramimonas_sp.AAC.1